MNSNQALDKWKTADSEARAAESRLLASWDLYERRLVAPPAEDLLLQVTFLRARANEALWAAMITLSALATKQRLGAPVEDDRQA